jgi:5-methylcytosine-specific restriction endonuclease McrA
MLLRKTFCKNVKSSYKKMTTITPDWLKANGHDESWLDQWLAPPVLDQQAVHEWVSIHRFSDARLLQRFIISDLLHETGPMRKRRKRRESATKSRDQRRQARLQTPFPCTVKQRLTRLAMFGGKCAYCGKGGKMTADHVIPLNQGGLDEALNIVPCCQACNSSKHANPMEEWYQRQSFFTLDRLQKIKKACAH